jgi:transposase
MRRHELSDKEWELIKDALPAPQGRGRKPTEARKVLNGMFWILRTGAPWRDLPERYGPWRTVYDRFSLWSRDGTLDRIVSHLQSGLDEQGRIDWELFSIDGSSVRASRSAAGARKKSGRASR